MSVFKKYIDIALKFKGSIWALALTLLAQLLVLTNLVTDILPN